MKFAPKQLIENIDCLCPHDSYRGRNARNDGTPVEVPTAIYQNLKQERCLVCGDSNPDIVAIVDEAYPQHPIGQGLCLYPIHYDCAENVLYDTLGQEVEILINDDADPDGWDLSPLSKKISLGDPTKLIRSLKDLTSKFEQGAAEARVDSARYQAQKNASDLELKTKIATIESRVERLKDLPQIAFKVSRALNRELSRRLEAQEAHHA